jgi:hypothetical protein
MRELTRDRLFKHLDGRDLISAVDGFVECIDAGLFGDTTNCEMLCNEGRCYVRASPHRFIPGAPVFWTLELASITQ